MGKRSSFERNPRDFYPTPREAVVPLLRFLQRGENFIEPCAGNGALVDHLNGAGQRCVWASDIDTAFDWGKGGYDAQHMDLVAWDVPRAHAIITNPPWDRKILHPIITRFIQQPIPSWLLIDADWAHTKQAAPFLKFCTDIVAIGRVRWIPGSKHTGKDNCCWYRFDSHEKDTVFHGRTQPVSQTHLDRGMENRT